MVRLMTTLVHFIYTNKGGLDHLFCLVPLPHHTELKYLFYPSVNPMGEMKGSQSSSFIILDVDNTNGKAFLIS